MANGPQQIIISLTAEQVEKLEALKKLSGQDATGVFRNALSELYTQVMNNEEGKKIAKINALLDVQ